MNIGFQKIEAFEKDDVDRMCLFFEFLVKREAENSAKDAEFKKQGILLIYFPY